ncbi:unnamed protein product [Brassica napus]|uniref:Uncharacterized protein n=3 Tax=Brassica TaxID=3705 RepID=A0A0D3D6V3_BRAOL|nr:unnamed protein product [Brassica napus]VDD36923.1 unnamed protein product [Brassica oleracea]
MKRSRRSRVSKLHDAAGNSRVRSTVHRNPPNSSPPEIRIRRHLSSLCELSLTSHFKTLSLLSDLIVVSLKDWRCNGPLSHQFEAESFSSSRDLRSANQVSSRRLSFSSSLSDGDHSFRRGGGGFEHAYSFLGMHCIFNQCKSSGIFLHLVLDLIDLVCDFSSWNDSSLFCVSYVVTVLKFGHMSSMNMYTFWD